MRKLELVIVVGAVALAVGCGGSTEPSDGGNPNGNPVLAEITATFTPAQINAGETRVTAVVAHDTKGAVIPDVAWTFTSDAATVADVSSGGRVVGLGAGPAKIAITGKVGSVTKATSVDVVVIGALPSAANVITESNITAGSSQRFVPDTVAVAQGGTVTWTFDATDHDLYFTTAGPNVPAGIPVTHSASVQRTFSAKGNYKYYCSLHLGMTGEVIVR